MNTNGTPTLTTCTATGCTMEFIYVAARGERANLCMDHGDAFMRANGHQNDPHYSVD